MYPFDSDLCEIIMIRGQRGMRSAIMFLVFQRVELTHHIK